MIFKNFKVDTYIVDKDGNKIESKEKDGWCELPLKGKIVVSGWIRTRTIVLHWFERTSFSKVCRNLKYRKAYDFFYKKTVRGRKYPMKSKQAPHKYRFKWR